MKKIKTKKSTCIIGIITAILQVALNRIPLEMGMFMQAIVNIIAMLFFLLPILSEIEGVNSLLFSVKKRYVIIFTLAFAIVPSLLAYVESDGGKISEIAAMKYIKGNLVYNIVGAIVACILYYWAAMDDHRNDYLNKTNIRSIINFSIPISFCLAFSYQYLEQQNNNVTDHATSLIGVANQNANILFLMLVYNLCIASVVIKFSYAMYCYKQGKFRELQNMDLVVLSVSVIFFYVCATNELLHIRVLYLIFIPGILSYSIFLMSCLKASMEMLKKELFFLTIHLVVYSFAVLKQNGVVDKNMYTYLFWCVIVVLLIAIAFLLWSIIQQESQAEVMDSRIMNVLLDTVCEGTDINTADIKKIIAAASSSDNIKSDVFMRSLPSEFFDEMEQKGIIDHKDDVSYVELERSILRYKTLKNEG